MREVREAINDSVATTSSSGDGASRWSESQNESRPHSSARSATCAMVSSGGHPEAKETETDADFYLLHAITPG